MRSRKTFGNIPSRSRLCLQQLLAWLIFSVCLAERTTGPKGGTASSSQRLYLIFIRNCYTTEQAKKECFTELNVLGVILVVLSSVLILAGVLYMIGDKYFGCFRSKRRKVFHEAIQRAKQRVLLVPPPQSAQEGFRFRELPRNGTYQASYLSDSSEPRSRIWNLRFEPSSQHEHLWHVHGKGTFPGMSSISEGCFNNITGYAYWVERKPNQDWLSSGYDLFGTLGETGTSEWHSEMGSRGNYLSFVRL